MENPEPQPPVTEPTPVSLDKKTRDWTLYTHLSGLCCFVGIPSLVGPLVCWLAKRDEIPQVNAAGKDAINFHITMLLVQVISIPLAFFIIGFATMFAAMILSIVCTILASVAAGNDQPYRYPLTYEFLK